MTSPPNEHAASGAALTPGGVALQRALSKLGKSQQWLVDEINTLRVTRGNQEKAGRSTVWRWMSGKSLINIDDATLIERIAGVPMDLWSQYEDVKPRGRSEAA